MSPTLDPVKPAAKSEENHMQQPTAIITDPERRKTFEAIFGTNVVPITSYLPEQVRVPEKGTTAAYFLDVKRITPEQRAKIVDHVIKRFHLPRLFVEANLEKTGMPILADQCTVAIPGAFFS